MKKRGDKRVGCVDNAPYSYPVGREGAIVPVKTWRLMVDVSNLKHCGDVLWGERGSNPHDVTIDGF